MEQSALLTTASLLTVLLITLHLTGDILFHLASAGLVNLVAVFIFAVQLYATLVLGGRRAGYIIILLDIRPGAGCPCRSHERGAGGDWWRHRQLQSSFPFCMDNSRVGNHLYVFHHPVGERTVALAMAPEPRHVHYRIVPDCGVRPATSE